MTFHPAWKDLLSYLWLQTTLILQTKCFAVKTTILSDRGVYIEISLLCFKNLVLGNLERQCNDPIRTSEATIVKIR